MPLITAIALGALAPYLAILAFLVTGILRLRHGQSLLRPTVSVVVAARNEAKNLPGCLDALLAQTYAPSLTEIIVVDDRSTDGTAAVLNSYERSHQNLRSIRIHGTQSAATSPKKHALSQGITSAQGDLIFITDADCAPSSDWLASMVSFFDKNVGVVIGPAPLVGSHGFLSRLLALDSLAAMLVAAGAAGWNIGATCTGRNLAYRKNVYEEVGGFERIQHSLSGDDDLFLQLVKRRTSWRVTFALTSKAVVNSPVPTSFLSFLQQRRRHVSASKFYSKGSQAIYLLFNLANLTLFVFIAYSISEPALLPSAALLFGLKLGFDLSALFLIARSINVAKSLFLFPGWEIFFILTQTLISPLGLVGKIKWKV
ncbi:MAG: glycosyltransferase [Caldithrix sp.]|nr:MAG: glycosyltransferase [Caldithrix sp.]